MAKIRVSAYVFFISCMVSNPALAAEENGTIGLGIGVLYNGLGLSYGLKNENSLKYISLGCMSVSVSDSRGTESNCGVGVGLVRTDLIENENNRHGVGFHVGATYNEHLGLNKVELFAAPQYIYFLNGIDKNGLNFGASVLIGKFDGESKVGAGLQAGYQF